MNEINFTANYIKNVTIQRHHYNKYKPCKVSLIEMDPTNKNDVDALYKTTRFWDESLTAFTYDDMKDFKVADSMKVYALTTQKTDFQKPSVSKILGIVQLNDRTAKDGKYIEVLQTNPKYIYNAVLNKTPKYKNIGKNLIKYVKTKFSDEGVYLYPTQSAVSFYEKQGFGWFEKFNNIMFHKKVKN